MLLLILVVLAAAAVMEARRGVQGPEERLTKDGTAAHQVSQDKTMLPLAAAAQGLQVTPP